MKTFQPLFRRFFIAPIVCVLTMAMRVSGAQQEELQRWQYEGNLGESRIGLTLILAGNRIDGGHYFYQKFLRDIPITGSVTYYEKYLNIYPYVPEQWAPNLGYGVQVQLPIADIGCVLTINSSSVPSMLLNHASFMFDQDIAKTADVPQNDKDLYKLLEDIHVKKNEVFEACITDEARELFR